MSETDSSKKPIIYWRMADNDSAVFAPKERAELIDRIIYAIENAKTWGEFRKLMPREEYLDRFSEYDEEFDSSDPFDESMGYDPDGLYPPWLQAEMETFIDMKVLYKFGEPMFTSNGVYYDINEENAQKLAHWLSKQGFTVVRMQDMKFD